MNERSRIFEDTVTEERSRVCDRSLAGFSVQGACVKGRKSVNGRGSGPSALNVAEELAVDVQLPSAVEINVQNYTTGMRHRRIQLSRERECRRRQRKTNEKLSGVDREGVRGPRQAALPTLIHKSHMGILGP